MRLLLVSVLSASLGCAGAGVVPAPGEQLDPCGSGALRVMTFNIQSGLRGLDKIAELIRFANPDVVALQEVDVDSDRSHGLDEAQALADKTGMTFAHHFKTTRLHGGDYGIAVLSRRKVLEIHQTALPTPSDLEPRTVAEVVLDVDGQPVSVFATHLTHLPTRTAIRVEQAKAILALMPPDRPRVLMGDLNDGPDSDTLATFTATLEDAFQMAGEGPDGTFPFVVTDLRLDYVLTNGLTPKRAFVLQADASDHRPVVADLALRR